MHLDWHKGALVSPAWVDAHRDDPLIKVIEIAGTGQEEMQAYKAGHVPGAICWWWKDALWHPHAREFLSPKEFAEYCGAVGIGNQTTVVFYGEPLQFGVYAWWVFKYCGHEKVHVLDGGRYRWATEGRPLVGEASQPSPPVRYTAVSRNDDMRIHRDKVLKVLGRTDYTILDGRSREEYEGLRVNAPGAPDVGALRYGRIPGAKHIYFEDLLTTDKSFKPVEQIDQIVRTAGAGRDNKIIAYCRMSHRATVLYFVLTEILGFEKVQVYDGSWTEWGNLVDVPVER